MKEAYPIVLTPTPNGYVVYFPDFDANTQGKDLAEAIYMARDAIGLVGITREDEGLEVPVPSSIRSVAHEEEDIVTLIDIDFDEYRRQNEQRTVRKNCTLPGWLSFEAERAGINFSAVLQNALKQELHMAPARSLGELK